jgi:hypothetical protein
MIIHWGTENINHNETSPTPERRDIIKRQITSVGEDMEEREILYTVSGNAN